MRTRWIKLKQNHQRLKWQLPLYHPLGKKSCQNSSQYQQHQIDSLVGQVKKLVSAVKATRASSRGANTTDGPGMQPQNSWRGGSRGRGLPRQAHPRTTPQPRARDSQGAGPTIRCWQCGEMGHYRRECPTLKGEGLFKQGSA